MASSLRNQAEKAPGHRVLSTTGRRPGLNQAGGRKVTYDVSTGSCPIRCCHVLEEGVPEAQCFADRLTAIRTDGRTTLSWVGICTETCRHNLDGRTDGRSIGSVFAPKLVATTWRRKLRSSYGDLRVCRKLEIALPFLALVLPAPAVHFASYQPANFRC